MTISTPSSLAALAAAEAMVERAMNDTRNLTIESILLMCEDIAAFGGTAVDCVTAIRVFQRRVSIQGNKDTFQ